VSKGTVAVTGATGTIGPAVVHQLVADGWEVRAFARHPPPIGLLPERVQFVQGDVSDEKALRVLLEGTHAVHHLAGHAHSPSTGASAAEYSRVNVDGARTVVNVAQGLQVPHFVYYSSTSVYGTTEGRPPADEDTPIHPVGAYATSKAAAEQIVLMTFGDQSTVLRLAAVYGPRVKGNYRRLLHAISHGRYVSIGPGLNRRTVVFVDDVASAAVLAARANAPRRVFNVSDGQIHQLREIVAAIGAAVGKTPPATHIPVAAARLAARLFDLAAALRLTAPGTPQLAKYLEDSAVRADRIQHELGFRPAFDLTLGWRNVAEAMRREGAEYS